MVCEDDHTFTSSYDKKAFFANLSQAAKQGADLVSGGIGGFGHAVPIDRHHFWVDWFYSTQFIIIFDSVFDNILQYNFLETDAIDIVLSKICKEKQVLFPFVSPQKNFGYSDATKCNNQTPEKIEYYFQTTTMRLQTLLSVFQRYHHQKVI